MTLKSENGTIRLSQWEPTSLSLRSTITLNSTDTLRKV